MMKSAPGIHLRDVQAVYSGPEGRLWELLMGEQIHIGGLQSSSDLADRVGIQAGQQGVDLCCASGAGMRFLVRFRQVARSALADPMVGSTLERAARVVRECRTLGAEALVVCRIPGASHCAWEGTMIREWVNQQLDLPSIELEIPPICDAMLPALGSRLQALIETARSRRRLRHPCSRLDPKMP